MKKLILSTLFVLALTVIAAAQVKVQVKFPKGAASTTVKGHITGYNYIDYIVTAKAGQNASAVIKSSNPNNSFYVYDASMETLEAADGVMDWSGAFPADGKYTFRVILPRSAARRKGAAANFSLTISIQ